MALRGWSPRPVAKRREPIYPDGRYLPATCNALFKDRSFEQWDLDGVNWADADLPPRKHACFVQTRAYVGWFTLVERCACGAIRYDGTKYGGEFINKNETRDSRERRDEKREAPNPAIHPRDDG